MIEFKSKKMYSHQVVGDWAEVLNLRDRTYHNFEFSYCNYRVGTRVFTKMSPGFMEAFKKEKMWAKLRDDG